jgi:hypothetical protein
MGLSTLSRRLFRIVRPLKTTRQRRSVRLSVRTLESRIVLNGDAGVTGGQLVLDQFGGAGANPGVQITETTHDFGAGPVAAYEFDLVQLGNWSDSGTKDLDGTAATKEYDAKNNQLFISKAWLDDVSTGLVINDTKDVDPGIEFGTGLAPGVNFSNVDLVTLKGVDNITQNGGLQTDDLTFTTVGNITLTNAANDFQGTVTIATAGDASFVDSTAITLGTVSGVQTLSVTGTTINLTGDITTAGNQTFTGPVVLQNDVVDKLTTNDAGTIKFNNDITSPTAKSLTLTSVGSISAGKIDLSGGGVRGDLTVTFDSDNDSTITSTIGQITAQGVTIKGGTTPNDTFNLTGDIDATGAVAISQVKSFNLANSITTNGKDVSISAGTDVTFAATGKITTANGNVTITADSDSNDVGKFTMADGSTINSALGKISISAGQDATITGLTTTNNTATAVTITSTAGNVLDGGDTNTDVDAAAGRLVINASGNIGDLNGVNAFTGAIAGTKAIETKAAALDLTSGGNIVVDQTGATTLIQVNAKAGGAGTAFIHSTGNINAGAVTGIEATDRITLISDATLTLPAGGLAATDLRLEGADLAGGLKIDADRVIVRSNAAETVQIVRDDSQVDAFAGGGLTLNADRSMTLTDLDGDGDVVGDGKALAASAGANGNIAVTVGTVAAGSLTVASAVVGSGTGSISLKAQNEGDVLVNANVSTDSGKIDFNAERDIVVTAKVSSSLAGGDVTFLADSDNDGGGGVWVKAAGEVTSAGSLSITGSDLSTTPAADSIAIDAGNAILATNDVTLQAGPAAPAAATIVVQRDVTSTTGNVVIDANGNSVIGGDIGAGGDVRIGPGGVTRLGGNVTGNDIKFQSAVQLTSDVTVSGKTVLFQSTLNDDGGGGTPSNLIVTATTTATFSGNVGANPLDSMTVNGGGATNVNGGGVSTIGAQKYDNDVAIGSKDAVFRTANAATGNVSFNGKLDGPFGVTVNTTLGGTTTFAKNVGETTALASLKTDAPGKTVIESTLIQTNGAQLFADAVELKADLTTRLLTDDDASVTFSGPVTSPTAKSLVIESVGGASVGKVDLSGGGVRGDLSITFDSDNDNSAPGATAAVGQLTVDDLTILGGTDLDEILTLNGDIDATGLVSIKQIGSLELNTNLTTNAKDVTFEVEHDFAMKANGHIVTNGGKVSITANQGDVTINDGATINSGAGTITLTANEDVTVTGLTTTSNAADAVTITAKTGNVLDGGETNIDVSAVNGTAKIVAAGSIGDLNGVDPFTATRTPTLIPGTKSLETSVAKLDLTAGTEIAVIQTGDVELLQLNANADATKTGQSLIQVVGNLNAGAVTGIQAKDNVALISTQLLTVPAAGLVTADLRLEGNDLSDNAKLDADRVIVRSNAAETVEIVRDNSKVDAFAGGGLTLNADGSIILTDWNGDGIGATAGAGKNVTVNAKQDIVVVASVLTPSPAGDIALLADSDNNGVGGVWIQSTGEVHSAGTLSITGADLVAAPPSTAGLSTAESIVIDAKAGDAITAVGNISLSSTSKSDADIFLFRDVTSSAGKIGVTATRDVVVGAKVSTSAAAGDITLLADAVDPPNGAGGVWVQAGGQVNSGGKVVVQGSNLNVSPQSSQDLNAKVGGIVDSIVVDADGANEQIVAVSDITLASNAIAGADVIVLGAIHSTGKNTANPATSTYGSVSITSSDVTYLATTIKADLGNVNFNSATVLDNNLSITATGNTLDPVDATKAGNVTFASTVNSDGGNSNLIVDADGVTTFTGVVGTTKALDSVATDAPGETHINGAKVVTTGDQTYSDNVVLNALPAALNTTTLTSDANVTFKGTLRSETDGEENLIVSAKGATTFEGAVGDGGKRLSSLVTNAGGMTHINGGKVQTTGLQNYQDAVVLGNDATLTTENTAVAVNPGNVVFDKTVDAETKGGAGLNVLTTGGGQTVFNGEVGSQIDPITKENISALSYLTTDAPGETHINGGKVQTTGLQNYKDAVVLGQNAILTTDNKATEANPGNVVFDSTVDAETKGGAGLDVQTTKGGQTVFNGAVGVQGANAATALAYLTTDAPGVTHINGQQIQTTGLQNYQDAVILGKDATLTTTNAANVLAGDLLKVDFGNVVFDGTVDAAVAGTAGLNVVTNGSGRTVLNKAVGTTALTFLTTDGKGVTEINGELVQTTGAQSYGDAVIVGDGKQALTAGGNLTFLSTVDGAAHGKGDLVTQSQALTRFAAPIGKTTAIHSLISTSKDMTFENNVYVTVTNGTAATAGSKDADLGVHLTVNGALVLGSGFYVQAAESAPGVYDAVGTTFTTKTGSGNPEFQSNFDFGTGRFLTEISVTPGAPAQVGKGPNGDLLPAEKGLRVYVDWGDTVLNQNERYEGPTDEYGAKGFNGFDPNKSGKSNAEQLSGAVGGQTLHLEHGYSNDDVNNQLKVDPTFDVHYTVSQHPAIVIQAEKLQQGGALPVGTAGQLTTFSTTFQSPTLPGATTAPLPPNIPPPPGVLTDGRAEVRVSQVPFLKPLEPTPLPKPRVYAIQNAPPPAPIILANVVIQEQAVPTSTVVGREQKFVLKLLSPDPNLDPIASTELPNEAFQSERLQRLFQELPDGAYEIDLVLGEGNERPILRFDIRQGKPVVPDETLEGGQLRLEEVQDAVRRADLENADEFLPSPEATQPVPPVQNSNQDQPPAPPPGESMGMIDSGHELETTEESNDRADVSSVAAVQSTAPGHRDVEWRWQVRKQLETNENPYRLASRLARRVRG